jgi:hypothetical protein
MVHVVTAMLWRLTSVTSEGYQRAKLIYWNNPLPLISAPLLKIEGFILGDVYWLPEALNPRCRWICPAEHPVMVRNLCRSLFDSYSNILKHIGKCMYHLVLKVNKSTISQHGVHLSFHIISGMNFVLRLLWSSSPAFEQNFNCFRTLWYERSICISALQNWLLWKYKSKPKLSWRWSNFVTSKHC